MTTTTKTEWTHEIGDLVEIPARIVGRSEFETGWPTYLVEYERNGKTQREWFRAEDLA